MPVAPSFVKVTLIRLAVLFGCFLSFARAHDPGLSTAQGEIKAAFFEIVIGFAPADVEQLLPPSVLRAERWDQEHFELVRPDLLPLARGLWEIRAGDSSLQASAEDVQLLPGDNVSFTLRFPVAKEGKVTMRALSLSRLPSAHRQFVIITDERGEGMARKLLSAKDNTVEVPIGVDGADTVHTGAGLTFWRFISLGVEHIWTGYDHLLFLFALLIVCRTFRSIVGIVTCFTVAHSLTLAMATLDVVNLPSRWVEAAIAASIVFVGIENLCRKGEEPRGRWVLTFAFGLIHGFGFASVLRDLGVGYSSAGIAMPLLAFNLGVELGQIAIALVVMPLVWRFRKNVRFLRIGVPAVSLAVAVAGLYWLVERMLLD